MWLKHAAAILQEFLPRAKEVSLRSLADSYVRRNKNMGKRDREESLRLVYGVIKNFLPLRDCLAHVLQAIAADFEICKNHDNKDRLLLQVQLLLACRGWQLFQKTLPAYFYPPSCASEVAAAAMEKAWQSFFSKEISEKMPLYSPQWFSRTYSFEPQLTATLLSLHNVQSLQHILHGLRYAPLSTFTEQWDVPHAKERASREEQAPLYIRVCEKKITKQKLRQLLLQAQPKKIITQELEGLPALRVFNRANLQSLQEFKKGFFEVQDIGSLALAQACARALPTQKNYLVIDACAGAGGKSLYLAELLPNAEIVAFDNNPTRLQKIHPRLKRAEATNIKVYIQKQKSLLREYQEKADVVFIDAPCSGSGTTLRNPENAWRYGLADIVTLQKQQKEILATYASLVKKGGRLVYATCSLWPHENEQVAEHFSKQYAREFLPLPMQNLFPFLRFSIAARNVDVENEQNFFVYGQDKHFLRLYPFAHGSDAFFAAAWTRTE